MHVRLDSTRPDQTSCFLTLLAASFFFKNNFPPVAKYKKNKKNRPSRNFFKDARRSIGRFKKKIKFFSTGLVPGIRRIVSRVRGSSSRVRATTSCSQHASEPSVSPLFTDWTRDNTGQPSESPPVKPSPFPQPPQVELFIFLLYYYCKKKITLILFFWTYFYFGNYMRFDESK